MNAGPLPAFRIVEFSAFVAPPLDLATREGQESAQQIVCAPGPLARAHAGRRYRDVLQSLSTSNKD